MEIFTYTSYSNTKYQFEEIQLAEVQKHEWHDYRLLNYGGGGGQAHKQTNRHTHTSIPWHSLAQGPGQVKITQIQNAEMQKYKWHKCKNTNYSVVVLVLVVEV